MINKLINYLSHNDGFSRSGIYYNNCRPVDHLSTICGSVTDAKYIDSDIGTYVVVH